MITHRDATMLMEGSRDSIEYVHSVTRHPTWDRTRALVVELVASSEAIPRQQVVFCDREVIQLQGRHKSDGRFEVRVTPAPAAPPVTKKIRELIKHG